MGICLLQAAEVAGQETSRSRQSARIQMDPYRIQVLENAHLLRRNGALQPIDRQTITHPQLYGTWNRRESSTELNCQKMFDNSTQMSSSEPAVGRSSVSERSEQWRPTPGEDKARHAFVGKVENAWLVSLQSKIGCNCQIKY